MKKRFNWGVVAFAVVILFVVIFLIGFGIFHSKESENIERDLVAELKTEYKLNVFGLSSNVVFTGLKTAKAELTIEYVQDNVQNWGYADVEVEKKNGKWTITFAPYDLSTIGKELKDGEGTLR